MIEVGGHHDVRLNVASFLPRSSVNGPGERAVLWVQGCDLRCPGCYNPGFLEWREHRTFSVDAVARAILNIDGIEGVTYSGGEPTLQAGALSILSRILRSEGLSVMCYSGHRYEELSSSSNPDVLTLLAEIDLLVDGPYLRTQVPGGLWRGSANQRLIALSDRYHELCEGRKPTSTAVRQVEVRVSPGQVRWTGVLSPEVVRQVEENLGTKTPDRVSR